MAHLQAGTAFSSTTAFRSHGRFQLRSPHRLDRMLNQRRSVTQSLSVPVRWLVHAVSLTEDLANTKMVPSSWQRTAASPRSYPCAAATCCKLFEDTRWVFTTLKTSTRVPEPLQACINCAQWSPDGQRIATGGADRSTIVWNVNSTSTPQRITHEASVQAVAWNPISGQLAIAAGTTVSVSATHAHSGGPATVTNVRNTFFCVQL